ncbi:PucR family transcriptional regulator [Paenibacillus whitsoniae]|nr:PucR family transcriptional regulator ligand-binding domain-containing protein [Paenibacillus whitsoniae]
MHLTVEEALTIYPLSHAKLVAGHQGVNRMLRSVNVMDAPDAGDWIKTGEMLLTTAYAMKDQLDIALSLLRMLDERGGAGLGIKVGRYWSAIPQELFDEANRLHIPILELPFEFTFSDQMDALFSADHTKTTKKLQLVLEKQKQLMQYALRQKETGSLFPMISGILGYPLAVFGQSGHLLYNNTALTDETLLDGWPWPAAPRWEGFGDSRCFRLPLMQGQSCAGCMKIYLNAPHMLKEEEALFHQAAEIVTHHLTPHVEQRKNTSRQHQLNSAFAGFFNREFSFHDLMRSCDHHEVTALSGTYQCVFTTVSLQHPNRSRLLNETRQLLMYHSLMQAYESEHLYLEDGLLSIFKLPEEQPFHKKDFTSTLSACLSGSASLSRNPNLSGVQCWVSRTKSKPELLHNAYRECLETKQAAERLQIKHTLLHYESIELFSLFQHLSEEAMINYATQILEPIYSKNKLIDPELVLTLEMYFEYDGSINETSRYLFVHRNTVSYRLEKLADILQMDFKKMNDLLRLKLAFLFRSYLKHRDSHEMYRT